MAATKTKTRAGKKKAAKPGAAKTKAAKPAASKSKTAKPEVPKLAASKTKVPKARTPKPAAKTSKAAKPAERKTTNPKSTKPKAGTTKVTKPEAARKVSQPQGEKPKAAKPKASKDVLDFDAFPPGMVTHRASLLCLACIFDLFTQQFGLAPRTAYNEIRRYAPSVEELTAKEPQRPFFRDGGEKNPRCPYCDAGRRWHARVETFRVEGGKGTDAARRALLKRLPARDEQFQTHEVRSSARAVFFEWLEALGQELDFEDDRAWMLATTRAYLERREPKTVWAEIFDGVRQVRRSQRVGEGFERDGARLFLAPALYNDVLLVQYLVSRSHRHGGRTFEGRLTLHELVRRMYRAGHLDARGITDRDQFDVLEQLVEGLAGGGAPLKLHYIVDRRDLLDKVKTVYARYEA